MEYWDGYGTFGGPVQVPVDNRVITGSRVVRGFGDYGDYGPSVPGGPIVLGSAPMLAPFGPPGARWRGPNARPYGASAFAGIDEEAAAAWSASVMQPSIWTGVAVGLSVWLLTKMLDRVFFGRG